MLLPDGHLSSSDKLAEQDQMIGVAFEQIACNACLLLCKVASRAGQMGLTDTMNLNQLTLIIQRLASLEPC